MAVDSPLYVGNAGLVLLSPYLPALFQRLELLPAAEDPPVLAGPAAAKAVRALEYLATGSTTAEVPALMLEKLLAGLETETEIAADDGLDEARRDVCDGLLVAVIGKWPIIKRTSTAGLRETFLQREGRLERDPDRWSLQVQRKALDMLVDQIPWSFGVVFHRWMARPIHVGW